MGGINMDTENLWPVVLQVIPTDDYKIYVYFNDGTVRLFDVAPLMKPDTVFEKLKDINVFKNAATVLNDTAAWDIEGNRDTRKCIDLDPFVLYEQAIVEDPIKETAA